MIAISIAVGIASIAAWDIGRRWLARERAKDREALAERLAQIDDLSLRVAKVEAFAAAHRNPISRRPHLSGIG